MPSLCRSPDESAFELRDGAEDLQLEHLERVEVSGRLEGQVFLEEPDGDALLGEPSD
jgi:hypothetical protein